MIVLNGAEVNVFRIQAGENLFDFGEGSRGGTVLDNYEWLTCWIDVWAMEGVAADYLNVFWQMLLKSCDLWCFT